MTITFKLPRQQRRAWFSRPRPSHLAQAVQAIPLTDPVPAAHSLNRLLGDLNATACGARRREQCLAIFHAPLWHLNQLLVDRLPRESVPLSALTRLQTEGLAELWSRLAVGHLCSLRDGRRRHANLLDAAALSAMQALGRLILVRYHDYTTAPAGAWQALHQCHQAASTLARRSAAPAPDTDTGDATDCDTAYKQVLIFGGTGPQRLRQSEQAALYQVLAHWAGLVHLRPLFGSEARGAALVFRPGDDEAPGLYSYDRLPDAPGLLMLDTAPLAARAHHRLSLLEAGDHRPGLPGAGLQADTLRALISAWSGKAQRRFPRVRSGRHMYLVLGLDAARAVLQGSQGHLPLSCQLVNQSASGYSLTLKQPAAGCVQVGELALARQTPSEGWTLGVVRWLRQGRGEGWVVGVEALSRQAQCVKLRNGGGELPALLLPANRAAHAPPTLITPRHLAAENGEFLLCVNEDETPMVLGRRVELTGSFCQYRFLRKT